MDGCCDKGNTGRCDHWWRGRRPDVRARCRPARRSVLILDHAAKPAEKIRISGGGRCNFTNLHSSPAAFLSHNRNFCKSALTRYTQDEFVQLVTKHQIAFHEKKLGQLFCDDSAQQTIDMLLDECKAAGAELRLNTKVLSLEASANG